MAGSHQTRSTARAPASKILTVVYATLIAAMLACTALSPALAYKQILNEGNWTVWQSDVEGPEKCFLATLAPLETTFGVSQDATHKNGHIIVIDDAMEWKPPVKIAFHVDGHSLWHGIAVKSEAFPNDNKRIEVPLDDSTKGLLYGIAIGKMLRITTDTSNRTLLLTGSRKAEKALGNCVAALPR
jgi:hypothetical protein